MRSPSALRLGLGAFVIAASLGAGGVAHADQPRLPTASRLLLGETARHTPRLVVVSGDLGARIQKGVDVGALARSVLAKQDPRAPRATLTETRRESDALGTFVYFTQMHLGVPVLGHGATVRFDRFGRSVHSASTLAEGLPDHVTPGVSAAVAVRRFEDSTRSTIDQKAAHLAFYAAFSGEPRLVWVLAANEDGVSPARYRVIVDATTGEFLERTDLRRHVDQARVYATNPAKSPNLELLPLPMGTVDGVLKNDLVRTYNCIDHKTVRHVTLQGYSFDAHVCDMVNIVTPDASGDYASVPDDTVAPGKDAFSELSMFYHATRAYRFFQDLSGDSNAQVVRSKPLPAVANLQMTAGIEQQNLTKMANPDLPLVPFQNAFFSPAGDGSMGDAFAALYDVPGGGLWFGQGVARDYAYDGDVVYHEFTHGVVDRTIQLGYFHFDSFGMTLAPGAMNEALSDYFSSAIAGDPDVGEYASGDMGVSGGVIRTLANSESCPNDVFGEVHRDSTLFSGGLWTARTSLPEADRRKFDAALYTTLRANTNNGDLDYSDLANLFLATLATDFPEGEAALRTAMKARGVLEHCDRIFTLQERMPKKGPVVDGFTTGWYATGTDTVGMKNVPGIAQFALPMNGTATKLTVDFSAIDLSRFGGGGGGVFRPRLLVRFGQPIAWKGTTLTADVSLALTASLRDYSETVDVPEGATIAYVQIANAGAGDGVYDEVTLTSNARAIVPPVEPPVVPPAVVAEGDIGGGCSTAPETPSAWPFLGLLAVGLVARRKDSAARLLRFRR